MMMHIATYLKHVTVLPHYKHKGPNGKSNFHWPKLDTVQETKSMEELI